MVETCHNGDRLQINQPPMKTNLKILSIILMSFVGLTALYGGWSLMMDPSGLALQMPVEKLKRSPFEDFFIPGTILFFILGCGSLLVLPIVLKGTPKATNFIILAGITISGWIVVQMIMLLEINWFHGVYLAVALALIYIGVKAESTQRNSR